jgi:hypothetical protein
LSNFGETQELADLLAHTALVHLDAAMAEVILVMVVVEVVGARPSGQASGASGKSNSTSASLARPHGMLDVGSDEALGGRSCLAAILAGPA